MPKTRSAQHPNPAANFGSANRHRAIVAASINSLRAARALQILHDEELPTHLIGTLRLRAAYPYLGLPELADFAGVTKYAYAARLRRMLLLADLRAEQAGIPNTLGVLEPGRSGACIDPPVC